MPNSTTPDKEEWTTDIEAVARSPHTTTISADGGEYVPRALLDAAERERDFWKGTDLPGRKNFNAECEDRPGVSVGEDLADKHVTYAMKAETAERKADKAGARVSELEEKLAVAKTDFERITHIGGMPIDSMLSETRQYELRGQATMDVANAAVERIADKKE